MNSENVWYEKFLLSKPDPKNWPLPLLQLSEWARIPAYNLGALLAYLCLYETQQLFDLLLFPFICSNKIYAPLKYRIIFVCSTDCLCPHGSLLLLLHFRLSYFLTMECMRFLVTSIFISVRNFPSRSWLGMTLLDLYDRDSRHCWPLIFNNKEQKNLRTVVETIAVGNEAGWQCLRVRLYLYDTWNYMCVPHRILLLLRLW